MSQPSIHNIQTKNLDKYLDNSIESISSDYERPPPPPPNDYYDQHSYKKKKSKHHHEPLPNIQILGHTAPPTKTIKSSSKTTTRKKKKKKTSKQSNRSITPPPPNNNTTDQLDLSTSTTRSASPPNKNGYSHHKNGHSHRYNHSPPLTSNIAKIEQQLQTYPLTGNGHIINGTNINNMHEKPHRANVNKVKKILGVEASFDFNDTPQNRKKKLDSISHSICSIESLDADDGTGFNPRETRRILLNEIHNDNMNTTSSSSDSDSETMSVESVKDKDEITKCKPKIRMWNALAYGLEDLIEGKTFEWVDSKYVRLLQLSTYSTVMGPKVKFVWKNSEIYNIQSLNIQSNDNDDYKEEIRKVRPEFAYHELEAWIAKQTLDCTGWKNKHNKTAPPPFTKKTMIAPEFGVVLCCIQFDSSLRALRNKQFNQYINGIYTHNNVHTPANVGHHINSNGNGRHVPHTPKSARTYSPDKNGNNRRGFGYKHGGGGGVAPTLSPYDHTGVTDDLVKTDDSSPNHQIPSSYSQKSYSSRYSSPPSGYRPVGDTLADYLSKFAPFSFSAGLSGGMNVSGANIPQVPYNRAMQNRDNNNSMGGTGIGGDGNNGIINGQGYINNSLSNIHHIDENEDPDDIGHYSLVLAVEYKYYEKFIESLDAIEHWLYMIASQIRYLLVLNKCFKCDQMQHSLHTDFNAFNNNEEEDNISSIDDEDDTDRLHTIIPFITNIAPTAIFKFDQLFSATFVGSTKNTHSHSHSDKCQIEDDISLSMSSSYLINDMCINYIPSRGLPEKISLFDTYFTCPLDNRDKHKLSIMISSHLQTLGRTLIVGNNENEIDRYISTLALFSTSQQKSLSRLSVKVDNTNNLSTHYIPELYLQGIVIPTIKSNINMNNININNSISDKDSKSNSNKSINSIDNDYAATVSYLQSSPAMKKLQQDLYLAPGPSTLVLLTSSNKVNNNIEEDKQSFWWIRQTAMPHKFKQEQQSMLFEKLFYLRRRPRRRNSSSYIYGRKRSANLFDSPPHKNKQQQQQQQNGNPYLTPPHDNNNNNNNHERTLERKNERMKENNHSSFDKSLEFKSMNKIYHSKKALNEDYEHNGDTIDLVDEISDRQDDNESVTNTSIQSNNISINNNNNNNNKELTFVEPSLSPMIATVVFGSFNIPQELKMTFLETQFRILLEKASEILLYIEHEQKDLLQFYDKTCHVMSCKEFKEQVPMEALYPQIMQKFESQLRSDLQISRQEDLYVLLSISEGFRPNLFSLMFGNPVFDIEVADILRYFLF